jgi:hypothetical protein
LFATYLKLRSRAPEPAMERLAHRGTLAHTVSGIALTALATGVVVALGL